MTYGSDRGLDPELEADVGKFLREPLLISEQLPGGGLKIVLQRQLTRYQVLNSRLVEAAKAPEQQPVAEFRRAQLFTRMGCSITLTPPPNRLAEEEAGLYKGLLHEQAYAVLQQASTTLDKVPADDPLSGPVAELAAIPEGPKDAAGIETYCAKTRDYWQDQANALTVDETEAPRCGERDAVACYVWGKLGNGGEDAMARACELGALVACPEETQPAVDG